jgi:hypothetical protein
MAAEGGPVLREWIIRLGFVAAVLGFFAWLAIHLATFVWVGWTPLDYPWARYLFIGYSALLIVVTLVSLTTHPTWTPKRGAPWWVRLRQTWSVRPLGANLLYLLIILFYVYSLWWLAGGFPQVPGNVAAFRSTSALWMGLSLSAVLSLGENGLGWRNRWVVERGAAQG